MGRTLSKPLKDVTSSPIFCVFPIQAQREIFVLIGCLFGCAVDHGVNEGEPVSEQYCEQENEDPFRDPEPEGQDLSEDYEDGKFNPIL